MSRNQDARADGGKLTGIMRSCPVLTFYILVFIISWPCMIAAFIVAPQNMVVQALCGLVAVFSPALVALFISARTNTQAKQARNSYRWPVFLCGWVFASVVMVTHTWIVRHMTPNLQLIIPTVIVALLPAWLISCALSRLPGVRGLFGTLLRPRGNVLWYLAALFIVPTVQLAGAGITVLFGGSVDWGMSGGSIGSTLAFIGLAFLSGFLSSGGINEETGWRGFALPRLQAKYPVIAAIVIVWFFWALWHLPYDIGRNVPLGSILFNRIVLNFIWAILFAWVYNRTKGSLLAPAIFHPAMNACGDALPRTDVATALFILLALGAIIYDRMWQKLPADSLAVKSIARTD